MGIFLGCPPPVFLRKNRKERTYPKKREGKERNSSRRKGAGKAWIWRIGTGERGCFRLSHYIIPREARGSFRPGRCDGCYQRSREKAEEAGLKNPPLHEEKAEEAGLKNPPLHEEKAEEAGLKNPPLHEEKAEEAGLKNPPLHEEKAE